MVAGAVNGDDHSGFAVHGSSSAVDVESSQQRVPRIGVFQAPPPSPSAFYGPREVVLIATRSACACATPPPERIPIPSCVAEVPSHAKLCCISSSLPLLRGLEAVVDIAVCGSLCLGCGFSLPVLRCRGILRLWVRGAVCGGWVLSGLFSFFGFGADSCEVVRRVQAFETGGE